MIKKLITGAIAIVLAANVIGLAANVNPWLGFVAAFVVFPLAILSIDYVPARVITTAIVAIVIGCGATASMAVASADDHTGQHLECWTATDGNAYCDWYWNE
jgi:hypothetical protein